MKRTSAAIIRSASLDDATAIAEIKVVAWLAAYRGIVPDAVLDMLDADDVRENWLGVRASELSRHGIVAVDDGQLAGYALFGAARHRLSDFSGQIFEIYVAPARFGSGIAAQLLDAALAHLRADGLENIMLWVFEANARARRFYEKHRGTLIQHAENFTEIGGARLREVAYGFRAAKPLK